MDSTGPALASVHRRRHVAVAVAVTLAALSWSFLLWIALDMGSPAAQAMMPMSPRWSAANALAVLSMWAIMMAAMMLPSALPMIRVFVALNLRNGQPARARAFVAAYLAVWLSFSVAAALAQWGLQAAGWVDPMAVSTAVPLSAALLLIAGAYQFSPLKRICLARCRSPMAFLLGDWHAGTWGAWTMGLRHGLNCVGCCWALMALLFVGGAMNLAWVVAVAIAVAIEKLAPGGDRLGTLLGLVLIAAGAAKLFGQF